MASTAFITLFSVLAFLLATVTGCPPRDARTCSMERCSQNGARSLCLVPSFQNFRECLSFATSPASKKQCSFKCPKRCRPKNKRPFGSNGKRYCSLCHLRRDSCRSEYVIYGPVDPSPSPKPGVSQLPTTVPDRKMCSVKLCVSEGAERACVFDSTVTKCSKWADSAEKRVQCNFKCGEKCASADKQPFDSFGRRFCTVCHLRKASCSFNFQIFVPVKPLSSS